MSTTERPRHLRPSRIRVAFLVVAVLAYLATEFGRFVYRPWVRRSGVDDFGLADSVGNLGGIVVQIFLTLAVLNPSRKLSFAIAPLLAAGYILYEFLQSVLPKGVFDWKDVIGTLLGLALALAALWAAWRIFPEGSANSD
jgi:hypothetical protein